MEFPVTPYVDCILPSRGVPYNGAIPDGKIQIRNLTVEEDLIIQSTSSGTALVQKLLAACCKFEGGFDALDLLEGDRMAVLIALRVNSFGRKYDAPYTCSSCDTLVKHVIDLGNDISEKPPKGPLTEPIEVQLPKAGMTVGMRFSRGRDAEEIAKVTKKKATPAKGTDTPDESEIVRLALQIVHVNDEKNIPLSDRERFIRRLQIADANKLRRAVDDLEPGIDTVIRPVCPNCNAVNERMLPFNGEFFRPTGDPA